jgi:BirA family biotin operon repressor/biotin-[acetyl-CoA-carboxylase] ligase
MLNQEKLRCHLPMSGIGEPLFFFNEVSSTNDVAISLANQGASHGTVILAEGQTAGRGQRGRKWYTVPGSGLAISIILRPTDFVGEDWIRYHGLGAIAVAEALENYGLEPRIKWPNDVLLGGKKAAGVLVDVSWEGEHIEFAILGIGINLRPDPILKGGEFDLEAISIEEALQRQINWDELLLMILSNVGNWYSRIHQNLMIVEWEKKLAYLGKEVVVHFNDEKREGRVVGLNENGALKLKGDHGLFEVQFGKVQVHLAREK